MFEANGKFRRQYDSLFKKDLLAITLLFLCEIADEKGQVVTHEDEMARLMAARFEDPEEYALGGRGK